MCLIWFVLNRRFVYETAYTTDLIVNLFKYTVECTSMKDLMFHLLVCCQLINFVKTLQIYLLLSSTKRNNTMKWLSLNKEYGLKFRIRPLGNLLT